MGKLVFAGAISHAPAATGWPEKADPQKKENFYKAAQQLGESILAAKPDVVIGIANDHVLNYNVRNFPNLAVGLSEVHSGPADWFKSWLNVPDYSLKGSKPIASLLYNGLVKNNVVAAAHHENFLFDDNYSVPLTLTGLTKFNIPFVPIMMNCTVRPVLSSEESYRIGKIIKKVIEEEFPEETRVAFLATGGLSHEPGGPKYFEIDDEFDRWALNHFEHSPHETIIKEVTYEKMEEAGSGGTSELLAWFVVMGAAGECKCEVLCYEAPIEWRCGMGAVEWKLGVPLNKGGVTNVT